MVINVRKFLLTTYFLKAIFPKLSAIISAFILFPVYYFFEFIGNFLVQFVNNHILLMKHHEFSMHIVSEITISMKYRIPLVFG